MGRIARHYPEENQSPSLNSLQSRCLGMLAAGMAIDAIAKEIGRSSHTVMLVLESCRTALGASTVAGAIAAAIRSGMLDGQIRQ